MMARPERRAGSFPRVSDTEPTDARGLSPAIPAEEVCCPPSDAASRRAFLAGSLGIVASACAGPTRDGSLRREAERSEERRVGKEWRCRGAGGEENERGSIEGVD